MTDRPGDLPDHIRRAMQQRGGAASASDLARAGLDDSDLARLVRRGQLRRVERGRYVLAEPGLADPAAAPNPWEVRVQRHLADLAAVLRVAPTVVAALRSAALVWGLPVASIPPRPEVLRPAASCRLVGVRAVRSRMPPPVVLRDGLAVTTLERTAIDVALDLPEPEALVTVDAALAAGADPRRMQLLLEVRGRVRGCVRARRTLDWADACSESALESRGRGELLVRGAPRPHCNAVVRFGSVEFRPDDLWLPEGIVGEADGRLKYARKEASDDVTDGEAEPATVEVESAATLYQEKRRQEWLETVAGLLVVRWSDEEARLDPDGLMARWRVRRRQREWQRWRPPPGLVVLGRAFDGRAVRTTQIWPPEGG